MISIWKHPADRKCTHCNEMYASNPFGVNLGLCKDCEMKFIEVEDESGCKIGRLPSPSFGPNASAS